MNYFVQEFIIVYAIKHVGLSVELIIIINKKH